MKKLLISFVVLANLAFPLRFGLAEFTGSDSPHHGRRVELVRRLKEAGRMSEIRAQKNHARLTGSGKKHIRRPLYTRETATYGTFSSRTFFDPVGKHLKKFDEVSNIRLSTTPHFLRAPPAALSSL